MRAAQTGRHPDFPLNARNGRAYNRLREPRVPETREEPLMSRMIKCPKCQSQIDVTNVAGGSTVPCADCGVMLRVPTGMTGQHPRVTTPAPQPAVGGGKGTRLRERQSPIFRKMAGARSPAERGGPPRAHGAARAGAGRGKSSGPVIAIVAAVLGVGLVGLLIFAMSAKSDRLQADERAREEKKAENRRIVEEQRAANARQEQEWREEQAREAEAAQKEKKSTPRAGSLSRSESGGYDIPASFEPGARKVAERQVKDLPKIELEDDIKKEYEALATAGNFDEIVKNDSKWMPYVIDSILSDDQKIAWSTYQALHGICAKHKISSKEDRIENPVKLSNFNSSYVRGGEFVFWAEWWSKPRNQETVRSWGSGPQVVAEAPELVKWDELVRDLRAGGGFDDPNTPPGRAFARLKLMGSEAYSRLLPYIENEDIMIGRAIVTALNQLCNKEVPLPTVDNKGQIKAQWESILRK